MSPMAVVVVIVLAIAVVLLFVGSRAVQVGALLTIAVVGLLAAAAGLSGGAVGLSTKDLARRQAEFGRRSRRVRASEPGPDEQALWAHERDLYAQRDTERDSR
jgi:hypothetical protein